MHTAKLVKSLLVVEDDPYFRESLTKGFQSKGYHVAAAAQKSDIQAFRAMGHFDYALVDLRLGAENGLDMIPYLLDLFPDCKIVVLTGYSSIATAVEAIKRGAINYLMKPTSIDEAEAALLQKALPEPEHSLSSLDQHEQEYIEYVMLKSEGNISKAAKWLKIHRQSLQRKLKRIGLR